SDLIWASFDAQRAADAALLVEDHGRPLVPAVGIDELRQGTLGLHLADVDHVDDALRADVRAGATEDAAEGVEPDVEVAHQAARRLGHRLGHAVALLDLGVEIDDR